MWNIQNIQHISYGNLIYDKIKFWKFFDVYECFRNVGLMEMFVVCFCIINCFFYCVYRIRCHFFCIYMSLKRACQVPQGSLILSRIDALVAWTAMLTCAPHLARGGISAAAGHWARHPHQCSFLVVAVVAYVRTGGGIVYLHNVP